LNSEEAQEWHDQVQRARFEEVEKALIKASKDSGSFKVRRGHDLLIEVLGTLSTVAAYVECSPR
jgi:hypothetical protein